MRHFWEQSARAGSLTNADYPYKGRNQKCKDASEIEGAQIASRAIDESIGHIRSSLDEMKRQIQNGPMTIAIQASGKCWRHYKSGVLSSKNKCPGSRLNHGVALVGLVKGSEAEIEQETTELKCRTSKKSERKDG